MGQSSGEVVAFAVVFPLVALFICFLRIWARRAMSQPLAWDDHLVFLATFLLLSTCSVPLTWLAVDDNLGNHQKTLPNGRPVPATYTANVLQLVLEVTSHLPIGLSKCSILLFYLRIFRGKVFTITTWTMFALVVIWMVVFAFASLFQCTPLPLYLRVGQRGPGVQCIQTLKLYYAHSGSDTAMDLIIMAIPWPQIWKLKMLTRTKLAVTAIFFLGALATAASITRMVEFVYAGRQIARGSRDITYLVAPTVYWSVIEGSLAIIAATLPALRPVFRHMSPESVIASIRSVFSLRSLRSAVGTNKGEGANGNDLSNTVDKNGSETSSAGGLSRDVAATGYVGTHETFIEGPGIRLSSFNAETLDSKNSIVVKTTWERSHDAV